MDIQFQHPEMILGFMALPFLGLLFWYVLKWKEATTIKIGDQKLVKELTKGHSPIRYKIKFFIALIALAVVIVAMINPMRAGSMDKVERKGVDVMIALDVSNSMLAEDIKPNRLAKAKQIVNKLIAEIPNDRVGLVLFAGRAYMQMPLTTDHTAAQMYVQNASPGVVPSQGTMLSDALRLCTSAFNSRERKYKSIVMITDGEDHDPESVEVATKLASDGVIVNTLGIGSPTGTPIPDPATGQYKKDAEGNTVLSKLNESQLKQISSATNGVYINAQDVNQSVDVIVKKLASIEQSSVEDSAFRDYIHYFQWFIAGAIILLFVEFMLPERKMVAA